MPMNDIKRIFLITVDCLRADYVGCIRGNLTPNIDKLARDSIVFTRVFVNTPGNQLILSGYPHFNLLSYSCYFLRKEAMP